MLNLTKEQAAKMLKEIDPVTDGLGLRFRTLFLISLGWSQEDAHREASAWTFAS